MKAATGNYWWTISLFRSEIVKEQLNIQPKKMALGQPIFYSGQGQVRFVKYESGHWQLLVDNKPFQIGNCQRTIKHTAQEDGARPTNFLFGAGPSTFCQI